MSTQLPTLGVIFHPCFPPETLMAYARRAESAGFTELWLWNDCFLPGAFTSAAVALAATEHLKVGIGLIPATVYHPLFAAMEITTLARAFPGRFMPGFGHGIGGWMKQIGAAPQSSLKTLEQTVRVVRALLHGERVSVDEDGIHLDDVQMELVPQRQPPLYIGAMREKSLQLAGRWANGAILPAMSSPAYVRWAREQISSVGQERASEFARPRVVVYTHAKVTPDGVSAWDAVRRELTSIFPWVDVHLKALGILEEAQALYEKYGAEMSRHIPDTWINALTSAGTPEQAAVCIRDLAAAGADAIILQPLNGDPACLDEYIRYLMPLFT